MAVGGSLKEEKGVYTAPFEHSVNSDCVLCYITFVMLYGLNSLFLNSNLYWEGDYWSDLLRYFPMLGLLPDVFRNLTNLAVSL